MFAKKISLITFIIFIMCQSAFAWNDHVIGGDTIEAEEPIIQADDPTVASPTGIYFATTSQKMFVKDDKFLWGSAAGTYTLIEEVVVPEYTLNLNISGVTGADAINGFTVSQVITGLTSDYTITGTLGDSTDLACTGTGVTGSGLSYLAGTASADVTADCVFSVASGGVVVTDDFTGTDNAGLSSLWTQTGDTGIVSIYHDQAVAIPDGTKSFAYYNDESFSGDHYAQAITTGYPSYAGPTVRWQGSNSGYIGVAGSTTVSIYRVDSGVLSNESGAQATSPTTGVLLRLEAIGDVITLYVDGVQKAQITDTTYTGGAPGIGNSSYSSSKYLDDWQGGDL